MRFKEWLRLNEDAGSPGAKQALYPMGYGGIGLYPPSDVATWAADAMVYMPSQMRSLKFIWGDGMLENPFQDDDVYPSIEGKKATQIQAGNLRTSGTGFEKSGGFAKYIQSKAIQAGSLDINGKGFEKSSSFIKDSPNTPGLWDLKQIGAKPGKFVLPVTTMTDVS